GQHRQRRGRGGGGGAHRSATAGTQHGDDREHDRTHEEQTENDRRHDAGGIGASRRGEDKREREDRDEHGDQGSGKASPPPAVEEPPPEAGAPLLHNSCVSSARERIVGTPSRGSSSACAVTTTARMPRPTGPS